MVVRGPDGVACVFVAALTIAFAPLPVRGVPISPVDPIRIVVGGPTDVHVAAEQDDRHVDVAVIGRRCLQHRQQVLGGGLQRADLGGLRHRTGIVERERNAQPRVAPFDGRGDVDGERLQAHGLHEGGAERARAGHHQLGAAS